MKWLFRILVALVVLVVVLSGVAFLLPAKFKVQRTQLIDAPPAIVYAQIVDPRIWKQWTVWNSRDPNMVMNYSGPADGVGARWSWQSATEGSGEMEFTGATPDQQIVYALHFPDFGMRSRGTLTLTAQGAGTLVSWSNEGELGMNPLSRWFGLFMDRLVGPDFEAGLRGLKTLSESRAQEAAAAPAPTAEPVPAEPVSADPAPQADAGDATSESPATGAGN